MAVNREELEVAKTLREIASRNQLVARGEERVGFAVHRPRQRLHLREPSPEPRGVAR
jgi:hypothetical protein